MNVNTNYVADKPLKFNESKIINRYRRGLETCPQANLAKSGRKYFLLFFSEASERRVWLSAKSKILASTFWRFRLYRFKLIFDKSVWKSVRSNVDVISNFFYLVDICKTHICNSSRTFSWFNNWGQSNVREF